VIIIEGVEGSEGVEEGAKDTKASRFTA